MKRTHYIYNIIVALFCWGMVTTAYAQEPTPAPEPNIKIGGSVYGGGALASVQTNTNVVINDGQFEQDVYGGGKGELNDDDKTVKASADVTGNTVVTVNGGTFTFPENGIDAKVNHNVYGGGNLACKIGTIEGGILKANTGNTTVEINAGLFAAGLMDGDDSSDWGKWKQAVANQDDNVAQGSVFGGGYGVNTSVLGMATVNINVADSKVNKAMVDVVGGGYNGYVLNKTSVTVQGVPEIYKIYGGGLGSHGGYDDAPTTTRTAAAITPLTMQETIGSVGEGKDGDGTNVLIKGGKFYNDIFGGGAGLKYNGTTSYLNVAEVFGKTNVTIDAIAGWKSAETAFSRSIYGGGALGMVQNDITVTLKSGEFKYVSEVEKAQVFGGSLGEYGHVNKAKVTGAVTVITTNNDTKDTDGTTPKPGALRGTLDIYGGCDMAQVDNTNGTLVQLNYGQFSGRVFGGGLGRGTTYNGGSASDNIDYGKVIGNTKVLVDGLEGSGDPKAQWLTLGEGTNTTITKSIKIYGGGALGLVTGNIDVDVESGKLYGEVFAGSLGEMGYPEKAKVTSPGYGEKDKAGYVAGAQCRAYTKTSTTTSGQLTGNFSIYGGCDMAKFDGSTVVNVEHGQFYGKIFGGGKGVASAMAGSITDYGKISGTTVVNYKSDGSFNGDIYGGGALGLVTPTGTPAYTTQVNLFKGVINGQVFGGGYGEKTNIATAKVTGNTKVETAGTENLTGDINHVYGGGDMAQVEGNTNLVITHGQFSGTIFGGGHGIESEETSPGVWEEYMDFGKVTGSTNVLIDGEGLKLGTAYTATEAAAANSESGAKDGDSNYIKAGDVKTPMNIYGGGALGLVEDEITVKVKSGTIYGAVFAGSLGEEGHVDKAKVTTNATISLVANDSKDALTGNMDIYGACDMAQFVGNAHVDVKHGDFSGRIFGGGKGLTTSVVDGVDTNKDYGKVIGRSDVLYDSDGTFTGSIYGGGALGLVERSAGFETPTDKTDADYYITKVRLKKGTINDGYVFGGSLGEKTNPEKAMIHGNTLVVTEEVDNVADKLQGNINHVYGGGDMAQVTGDTEVKITHGSFTGDIYGGGNGRKADDATHDNIDLGKVIGNSLVTIDGASIKLGKVDGEKINVYGGGALGIVTKDATVNMESGTVVGKIYGGSFGEEGYEDKAIVQNNTNVNINGGTITGDVFGGGALAKVDKDTHVYINNGSVSNEVYGGGALADVNQDTYVYLFGGSVHDVYGGGLGQLADTGAGKQAVEAYVKGNTLVQLGHINTSDVLEGSIVTGSIFGCNNVNGTPKGHAKVHVIKTTSRTDQASPYNTADVENSYDVLAVYGGGNKAAYQPWTETEIAALGTQDKYIYNANEKSEVLIEYCNNSIAYVYGGGNAAPVPATDVKIYGATDIDHAFAGGNGKGDGNDGADVGFLGFYSIKKDAAEKYGSGKASIAVLGGTVHNVYGGSNTLGYIRTEASVNVENPESTDPYAHGCDLVVGKTFGGGNEADIVGNIDMCLNCTEGADIVFAGANNANVYGNIHLTVNSGTFRQVFCSNNEGGAVFGKLRIDVDETGCTPIIIKELFGGGNLAPYSVYGYNDDGTCKTSGEQLYADPVVNIYSCTAIGTVYGGGFGNTAMVYGNPIVNVDMVKGFWAGRTIKSKTADYDKLVMVIKNGIVQTETEAVSIPDEIGIIGNIFGGGKEADVHGNTTVNVCVKDLSLKDRNHNADDDPLVPTSAFISAFAADSPIMSFSKADEAANDVPKGNIYGGGKMANVFGNTKVHIKNGTVEGDVFGAGQGDASRPDAALVKGKTEVIIGEE